MFLQWCRDELVLSFIFVQRLVSLDRTRLRKGTTAETQTLYATLGRHITNHGTTKIFKRKATDKEASSGFDKV